ncbi:LLM class flavin-dependent oxidoreductase [Antrihabitans cavernicola]|uniref:LLM class flavin-dependent oxidoreductase n=1 Tax=Antrihabitans cavernicola TaxID=2495913 RepID=A0A5A7SIU5_9NOCA|nr:LLM class flavin-dependent oxidoreductase [Spelaeibacter cavernicola]KAA0024647.1 LLM class flavin-dependent oxidoreductase [Spelaeibacter cavernicola]
MTRLKSALWFPLFDQLAEPAGVARLAAEAEEFGWDGVFVWDHTRWRAPVSAVADPWITLAAAAIATERVRIGPMVTPLARRRPVQVARETATLDRLSNGRLTLGVGLGSDRFGGEYSLFGEETDDRRRAAMLDESLTILSAAWSGVEVHHHGEHYTVDGVRFLPRPTHDRIPVWVAGFPGKLAPIRRAARHDGYFPVNLSHPDQLAESVALLGTGLEVVVAQPASTDLAPYVEAGATWWLTDFEPDDISVDAVRGMLRDGPR